MAPYKWTEQAVVEAWRNTVGDPSSGPATRWTDAEGVGYLNRGGQQLVLTIPELFETVWEIALVTDQREYMVDPGFMADKRVEFEYTSGTDNRLLEYLTQDEWKKYGINRDTSTSSEPRIYTFWRKLGAAAPTAEQKQYIELHPTPGVAENTKTLRIYGHKLPQEIDTTPDASEVVETEAWAIEAQIMWAAFIAMRDDDETVKARDFRVEFEEQCSKIQNYRMQRTRSERPKIRPRDSVFTRSSPYPPRFRGGW